MNASVTAVVIGAPHRARDHSEDEATRRVRSSIFNYTRSMAMESVVQRLQIGDVVLIDVSGQGQEVEAKVVRAIERTGTTVRALLRVEGREDFVREWPLGERVTIVRGP